MEAAAKKVAEEAQDKPFFIHLIKVFPSKNHCNKCESALTLHRTLCCTYIQDYAKHGKEATAAPKRLPMRQQPLTKHVL